MVTDNVLMDEVDEDDKSLKQDGGNEVIESSSSTASLLPPPPPLQKAPQYRASRTSLQERRGEGPSVMVSSTPVRLQERVHREEAEEGVSKLVMKASSGGGRGSTRRRALIHSIPKFSQVRPTHQLAVAQRLLQERLLQKRGGAAELLQGMAALEAQEQERRGRRDERVALQTDVKGLENYEDRELASGEGSRPVRRERKPRKTAICRIQPEEEREQKEAGVGEKDPDGAAVRHLPELTITRRPPPPSPLHHQQSISSPLDLSRPRLTSSPVSATSLPSPPTSPSSSSLSLVLQPPDYEALAPHHPLYATYIFLPSIGVFVHPLAIPTELAPHQPAGVKQLSNPKRVSAVTNNNTKGFNPKKDQLTANGGKIKKGDLLAAHEEGKVLGGTFCKSSPEEVMLVAGEETKTEGGAIFCKFKNVKTGSHKSSSIEAVHTTT